MTIWFIRIALLLLPFIAFALFWRHSRRHEEAQRYLLPALAGTIMLSIAMVFIAMALTQDMTGTPGEDYVPAVVIDGKVIDGRFEPQGQDPAGK